MRNMLALAALVVIVVAGVGYHRNWYTIQTQVDANGQRKVTVDIDNKRIGQDVHDGLKKSEEKLQTVLDNSKKTDTATDINVSIPNANQVGTKVQERVDQFGNKITDHVDQFGNKIGDRVDQFTNQVTDRTAEKVTDKITNKLDEWLPKR